MGEAMASLLQVKLLKNVMMKIILTLMGDQVVVLKKPLMTASLNEMDMVLQYAFQQDETMDTTDQSMGNNVTMAILTIMMVVTVLEI